MSAETKTFAEHRCLSVNTPQQYLQALPWEAASEEVHEHVTQCLQIIPSALLWNQE